MRQHVEFVQQERLEWQAGFLPETRERTLSRDPETGADSVVVSFPAKWEQDGSRVLGAAEEYFVLAGELTINGEAYGPLSYTRRPEGSIFLSSSSSPGAVAVLFRNRAPQAPAPSTADSRKLVERVELLDVAPSPMRTPDFPNPSGVARVDLFDDPDTGESTWVLSGPALHAGAKPEVHPVVEEMFLVAGEMHSPLGVMLPGAYFWRPEDVWHGPFSTVSGCVSLFRTQGGPLTTVYTTESEVPQWFAEDTSIIPDELAVTGSPRSHLDLWRASTGTLG